MLTATAQASKGKKVKIAALIHSFFLVPQETLKSSVFHSIKEKINITIKLKQRLDYNSTGGEIMAGTSQLSAGGMIGLAIILGILLALFPFLVIWLAWLAVIILFLGGIAALFTK